MQDQEGPTMARLYSDGDDGMAPPPASQTPETAIVSSTDTAAEPPRVASNSGVLCLDDDYGDGDEYGWCCCLLKLARSSQFLGLCTSILAVALGVSLLIVSITRGKQDGQNGTSDSGPLSPAQTQEYWLHLRDQILAAGHENDKLFAFLLFLPDSPGRRALQWMSLHDPLRPLASQEHILQRFTVVTLYYEWSGDSWNLLPQDGWPQSSDTRRSHGDTGTIVVSTTGQVATNAAVVLDGGDEPPSHECDWEGIRCNDDLRVISLDLDGDDSGISLSGTIPPLISKLEALQELHLTGHLLKGTLPKEIVQLQALTSLDLSLNRFVTMDYQLLGNLALLKRLDLSDNSLQGEVPMSNSLDRLIHLEELDLSANSNLQGEVFSMLLDWRNITRFNVGGTSLSGSLPDEIGLLTNLESLVGGFANFVGSIPTSIASCSNLITFSMGGSEEDNSGLRGTIPTEFGKLVNLQFLSISNNPLNSTLPTELGLMTNLHTLDAQHMEGLHGDIPSELGLLSNSLSTLYLQATSISGTLPTELALLTSLQTINIVGTQVHGEVPEAICHISTLREVLASCSPVFGIIAACSCCLCGTG